MNTYYRSQLILTAFILMFAGGCKKFVEVSPPQNQTISATIFSADQSATSAVVGLYSKIMDNNESFLNGDASFLLALSADEVYPTANSNEDDNTFYNNAVLPNSRILYGYVWRNAYSYIYNCNSIIAGLQNSSTLTPSIKSRLLGEAEFVRALCLFYLTNWFGDIPMPLTSNLEGTEKLARTSVATVYAQILSDLQSAISLLPESYTSTDRIRPNKWTAIALQARVYLYMQNWPAAESAADLVINSGDYTLNQNLRNVFLPTSNETIWQMIPVQPYFNTGEGSLFVPYTGYIPTYALTSYLVNSFEPGDLRMTNWVGKDSTSGTYLYYPFKYKQNFTADFEEYNIVFRLSEQYLIRAEARIQRDNLADGRADLNIVRSRAGLPDDLATSKDSLLAALQHENRIEFFAEWGHRWFDLKRTNQIVAVLNAEKTGGFKEMATLFPIPLQDIQLDPNLIQNPGY